MNFFIKSFFDENTGTWTHLVADLGTLEAAIIDPVLNFDLFRGHLRTDSCDRLLEELRLRNLRLVWILETHIHADHLTGANYLRSQAGGKIGIGKRIHEVLNYWQNIFPPSLFQFNTAKSFDRLWEDGDTFSLGELHFRVLYTPGHTPACVTYLVNDAAFVGDTIFAPHLGSARADFPGGDAKTLWNSLQKILQLPEDTRLFLAHDYPQPSANASPSSPLSWITVKDQKKNNSMANLDEVSFINRRKERDSQLAFPKLILPSLQVNLRAGDLGPMEEGASFIKIPINKI